MAKNTPLVVLLALFSSPALFPGEDSDIHAPSVYGLQLGMTAQQVLDQLERMPDGRQDQEDTIVVFWQMENGDQLQVNFRHDRVSHLALKFDEPKTLAEIGLIALHDKRSSLDARDPRARYEYKIAETNDQSRTVWSTEKRAESGYNYEVQFLSASRQEFGDQRDRYVEFKYVTVPKDHLKAFDQTAENPRR